METVAAGESESAPAARTPSMAGAEAGEREIIARAQAGDREEFRALVELHRSKVFGLALRILRSPHDAEDVAQEAFVRAWVALPRFRAESSLSTWLYRIVARRAFDRLETLKRRKAREAPIESADGVPAPAVGTEVEATRRARGMEQLIAALSPAQRAVVTLFYYEDRSVEQVAVALGIPVNTVKTHLARARAALREGWMRAGAEERT